MAAVTHIVLAVVTVRFAIALSQYETFRRNYELEQQLALITENYKQLQQMFNPRVLTAEDLEGDVIRFRSGIGCRFRPCSSYECTFIADDISKNRKHTRM